MTILIKTAFLTIAFAFSNYHSATNAQNLYWRSQLIPSPEITIQSLSKKWMFEKYKVFHFTEAPAPEEKNDYIHLKPDMTFSSISEGIYETGKWRLDVGKKRIYLSNKNKKGELVFIIDDLSPKQLVLIIDDPSDSDAQYLKIYFKN